MLGTLLAHVTIFVTVTTVEDMSTMSRTLLDIRDTGKADAHAQTPTASHPPATSSFLPTPPHGQFSIFKKVEGRYIYTLREPPRPPPWSPQPPSGPQSTKTRNEDAQGAQHQRYQHLLGEVVDSNTINRVRRQAISTGRFQLRVPHVANDSQLGTGGVKPAVALNNECQKQHGSNGCGSSHDPGSSRLHCHS